MLKFRQKRENKKKVDTLKYWEIWEDFQVFLKFKGRLKNDLERCLNLLQLNWWFISNRKKQRTNLNYEVNPLLCTRHLRATMLCFMKNSFFPVKEGCNQAVFFPANPWTLFAGNALIHMKSLGIWTKMLNYLIVLIFRVHFKLHNQVSHTFQLKYETFWR